MQPSETKRPHLLFLIIIAATGPLAMNILNPSTPTIAREFATSYDIAGLTLTLYLLSLGVAQLFVGSLSDRFGRRPLVLIGLLLFLAGTIACMLAPTIELLIAGRIIQAVGGCTGLVMGRTMIRDMYPMNKAASMMAYMVMIMVIVPIFAVPLGGFLTVEFNWQASMMVTGAFGIFALLTSYFWLHETHGDLQPMSGLKQMFGGFGSLLKNPRFNHHAFQTAFSSAAFFAFIAGSPFVMEELMGQDPEIYGRYFMITGVCYMAGNFITGRMSEKWGPNRLINLGTFAGFTGGMQLVLSYHFDLLTPESLFTGMAIIALGNGMSLPSGTTGAVSADMKRVGAAAGLAGFLQIAGGSLATIIVNRLLSDSAAPLVYAMGVAATMAFLIHLAGSRAERRAAVAET